MMKTRHKGKILGIGSCIGIIAPATACADFDYTPGIELLHQWGYKTKISKTLKTNEGYLAGSDKLRASELNKFFADDEVGELARICDNALKRFHEALLRERLFTADISHELRTPLTIIQTSAELLHMKGAHVGEAKRNELLERILGSCQSLHDLLNIFLNLARNTSFEIQESDTVHDTLNSIVEYYRPNAKAKGLELTFEVNDNCPGFYSPVVIGALAGNLIKNAILYTSEGCVKVTETATGFEVQDTGPGIDSENKDRIFSPHTRATDQQQGSGMGLSIVKRLCDRFGWKVELVSQGSQGACFKIVLLTGKQVQRVDQGR